VRQRLLVRWISAALALVVALLIGRPPAGWAWAFACGWAAGAGLDALDRLGEGEKWIG